MNSTNSCWEEASSNDQASTTAPQLWESTPVSDIVPEQYVSDIVTEQYPRRSWQRGRLFEWEYTAARRNGQLISGAELIIAGTYNNNNKLVVLMRRWI